MPTRAAVKFAVHNRCRRPQAWLWPAIGSAPSARLRGMRVKDAVGRFGEQLAVEQLMADGLAVLDRNWRCSAGELDIVAVDGDVLVFIEVKTRSSLAYGDPAEAVSAAKAARLRRLAMRWLADHPDRYWPELRFDVVAVLRCTPTGPTVRHLRGAF